MEMEIGKLKFIREGLMGRIVGLKSFILDRTDIESIWFKELGEFFSVTVSGEVREVRDALKPSLKGLLPALEDFLQVMPE